MPTNFVLDLILSSGTLASNGKKFDASRDRGRPFKFTIGVGQVIQGWDQGIVGLCKGAKANLIIPPEMGYGECECAVQLAVWGRVLHRPAHFTRIVSRTNFCSPD